MSPNPDPVEKLLEDLSLRLAKVDLAPPPGAGAFPLRPASRPPVRDRPLLKKAAPLRVPRAAAFVLGLLAALAGALWFAQRTRHASVFSLTFPAEKPVSLSVKDGQYLSFDRSSNEIVRLASDGSKVVERQAFPNLDAAALAFGRSCIWSVDPANRKVYRHHPDSCAILEAYDSPGPQPSAVYARGEWLWTADRSTRRVYRHAKTDGLPVLFSSPIQDEDPVDLAQVDERLWVLDGAASRVSRYRLGTPLAYDGTASLQALLPAGAVPVGFAPEGRWLWVMTRNPSSLHRIDARALRFR